MTNPKLKSITEDIQACLAEAQSAEELASMLSNLSEDMGNKIRSFGVDCIFGFVISDRFQDGDITSCVRKGSYLTCLGLTELMSDRLKNGDL